MNKIVMFVLGIENIDSTFEGEIICLIWSTVVEYLKVPCGGSREDEKNVNKIFLKGKKFY